LFGKGIYLAESSSKADEYGEGSNDNPDKPRMQEEGRPKEGRPKEGEGPARPPGKIDPNNLCREAYSLVSRATLGRVKYTDEKNPNPDALQKDCLDGNHESVLGDRFKVHGTFREFIVFNDDLVYPEYVVRYERVYFHERFQEIYRQMGQRQSQGRFNGQTPEEQEVLESMWNVFSAPWNGKIKKEQLLDLLYALKMPPENEGEDMVATFNEFDTNGDGFVDLEEFIQEMCQRTRDGIAAFDN